MRAECHTRGKAIQTLEKKKPQIETDQTFECELQLLKPKRTQITTSQNKHIKHELSQFHIHIKHNVSREPPPKTLSKTTPEPQLLHFFMPICIKQAISDLPSTKPSPAQPSPDQPSLAQTSPASTLSAQAAAKPNEKAHLFTLTFRFVKYPNQTSCRTIPKTSSRSHLQRPCQKPLQNLNFFTFSSQSASSHF